MECINCTQCIDACDAVMHKIGLPPGLIRYSSQASLEKKAKHILRARTVIYPLILVVLLSGFFVALKMTSGFTASVTRGKGTVFTAVPPSRIMNRFNLKLTNRTTVDQLYTLTVLSPDSATVDVIETDELKVQPREHASITMNVLFPSGLTTGKGMADGRLRITDQNGLSREVSFKLLGPKG
jgi:polyferredoxin